VSTETHEIVALCESLTSERRAAALDFVRSLHSKTTEGDNAWEQIINDPRPRPKLEAFIQKSAEEQSAEMVCSD